MDNVVEMEDRPKRKTPQAWAKFWQKEHDAAHKRVRKFRKRGNKVNQGNKGSRDSRAFEQVGFKLYNLSGNFAPNTNFAHFRIVESVDENSNQVGSGPNNTDFQGLYLVIEQPDGRLLDEHD